MPARKKPTASRAPTPAPETHCERQAPSEVSSSEAKGRVLIVEDDVPLSTVVEDALTYEGYAVVGTARSAEEAISMAVAHGPDLVLMDVRLLGNSDGIAAAEEILERTRMRPQHVQSVNASSAINTALRAGSARVSSSGRYMSSSRSRVNARTFSTR